MPEARRLCDGVDERAAAHGIRRRSPCSAMRTCLFYGTRDAEGNPSQPFRTLFLQETIERGLFAPSFVVSEAHGEDAVDRTIEIVDAALPTTRRRSRMASSDSCADAPCNRSTDDSTDERARVELVERFEHARREPEDIDRRGIVAIRVGDHAHRSRVSGADAARGVLDGGAPRGSTPRRRAASR